MIAWRSGVVSWRNPRGDIDRLAGVKLDRRFEEA